MPRLALSYREARARVLEAAHPLPPVIARLDECLGRALRRAFRAPHPLPRFANSAMDGFAVRAADLGSATSTRPVVLHVAEVVPAGRTASRPLEAGQAIRLMTGAMIPAGADAVVPFEESEPIARDGVERVRFVAPPRPGQHVREAGADVAADEALLEVGRELSAHDLGLLAGLGAARVSVGPRPRVAIVSTGDELLDVDEPLRPGAVRDSNTVALRALLEEVGARVPSSVRVSDAPSEVVDAIARSLTDCDVVISIGGVSAGDFDPVKLGLAALPGVELWHVAMKPGRPQAFGASLAGLYFGLPGNPASVACVFEALVRPALRRLQGFARLDRPRVRVTVGAAIESRRGRTDFVRVALAFRDGAWWATPAGDQVSGHLAPQSRAHALLVVPEEREALKVGERVAALLLRWPG